MWSGEKTSYQRGRIFLNCLEDRTKFMEWADVLTSHLIHSINLTSEYPSWSKSIQRTIFCPTALGWEMCRVDESCSSKYNYGSRRIACLPQRHRKRLRLPGTVWTFQKAIQQIHRMECSQRLGYVECCRGIIIEHYPMILHWWKHSLIGVRNAGIQYRCQGCIGASVSLVLMWP